MMIWSLLRVIVISYLLLVAILWIFQRRFIYFPSTAPAGAMETAARGAGLEPWRLADGTLAGWASAGGGRAWLVLHGNAGLALHRATFVPLLRAADPGAAVFLLEYPGYGARPGPPSESRIAAAAIAAAKDLAATRGGGICLLGESIGASFAAQVAEALGDRAEALILITPFARMADVAAHHFPFLPVRWLLRERHDASAALASYRGRAAIVVTQHDTIVPRRFGEALFQDLSCAKRLWTIPGADHNDIPYDPGAPWWREAVSFCTGASP